MEKTEELNARNVGRAINTIGIKISRRARTYLTLSRKSNFYSKGNFTAMKTIKRLLWVLLGITVAAVIGYFIFTGCQL